jgi:hypothetical protein
MKRWFGGDNDVGFTDAVFTPGVVTSHELIRQKPYILFGNNFALALVLLYLRLALLPSC